MEFAYGPSGSRQQVANHIRLPVFFDKPLL